MSVGVAKSLEVIASVQDLAMRGKAVIKAGPVSWAMLVSLLPIVGDLQVILADAPSVLPELESLDAAESSQLASAVYKAVAAVLAA